MPPLAVKTKMARRPKRKKTALKRSDYLEYRNVDRAVETATYFGFMPLPEPLVITREDREKARELGEKDEKGRSPECGLFSVEERVALMRLYHEKKWFDRPQPIMLCGELHPTGLPKKRDGERRLRMDILGTGGSIAEAILIETARAILKEEGCSETSVAINSMGDRDCGNRFLRELIAFYRKNINDLPAPCRALLRKNPVELLACEHDKCRLLSGNAPKAIAFLSETSRAHFKEVLEYLEELAVPFTLNPLLIGNRTLATETVFEIRGASSGDTAVPVLCVGLRYNSLARRLEGKDVQSVGATLLLPKEKGNGMARCLRLRKPSFFFLQLGAEAKRKSLKVIEVLREEKIPVYHALAREKLSSQMGNIEQQKIPYTLIMGQKEALDDSVIVRDATTRAQETVTMRELPAYLKKLKLA